MAQLDAASEILIKSVIKVTEQDPKLAPFTELVEFIDSRTGSNPLLSGLYKACEPNIWQKEDIITGNEGSKKSINAAPRSWSFKQVIANKEPQVVRYLLSSDGSEKGANDEPIKSYTIWGSLDPNEYGPNIRHYPLFVLKVDCFGRLSLFSVASNGVDLEPASDQQIKHLYDKIAEK
jgi:hypothetical protein